MTVIRKLFIANRAEIALRIVRTAQRMGIETVVPRHHKDRAGPAMQARTETIEVFGEPPVLEALPKTATGKIQKSKLRQLYAGHYDDKKSLTKVAG